MSTRTVSRSGWRMLFGELTRRRRAMAHLTAWSMVESLPSLLSGLLVAAALDQGFLAHRPLVGIGWLTVLGLTMVIESVATRKTFPWLADIVEPMRDVLVRTVVAGALARAVNGMESPDGAAVARLSGQAEAVRNLVAAMLQTLRSSVLSLVLALVGLFFLAPAVAAITVVPMVLSLVLFALTIRPLRRRQQAMALAEEDMAGVCTQVFENVRDVVACGAEDVAGERVDRAVVAQARAALAMARVASRRILIMGVGGPLPVVLMLSLAPWLLRTGRLTSGELIGAVVYVVGTLNPALHTLVATIGGRGGQLGVLLQRIVETGSGPVEPEPGGRAEPGGAEPQSDDLRIIGLKFAYGPCSTPVIDGLTLDIPAGGHMAIVGPSGIGKSTLASLIAGLAEPQDGAVLLGGIPLGHVARSHLRRTIALIPQEGYVFTGTLRANLCYLRPDATTADLDQAVHALGLRRLVERLGSYDARLGIGGPALSAGERQLIILARAFVSAATVLILDEATCHLDPAAEAAVEQALAATGRTLIVIAHRISSARRARQILLLDGTAATLGSHEELLAASHLYSDLVSHWHKRPSQATPTLPAGP